MPSIESEEYADIRNYSTEFPKTDGRCWEGCDWLVRLNGMLVARSAYQYDALRPDEFWSSDIPDSVKSVLQRYIANHR